MPRGPRWYVLQFELHQEQLAVRAILEGEDRRGFPPRQPFQVELPMIAVRSLRAGRPKVTHRMMFQGYGFVRFDPRVDDWQPLSTVDGVMRLFTTRGLVPLPVPFGFVEAIVADAPARLTLQASSAVRAEPHPPGTLLRVRDGPFSGFDARVVSCDGLATTASLPVFGRMVDVTLPSTRFEPA